MGAVDPKERAAFMPMTDTKTYPNAMKPAWNNDGLSQGTFGATFLSGKQWKSWDGRMVVGLAGIGVHGTPVGNRIDVLAIADDGSSATRTMANLPMPAGRFRSMVQGSDGNLYVATDEGSIISLKPN
jgi:glucose/arabinose dehydrogenase